MHFKAISWAIAMGLSSLGLLLVTQPGAAQLTPDPTLGNERSQLTPTPINGLPAIQIDGGAQRALNLFHSFQAFNVETGQQVYFANPVGVQTIITRVTGGNPSRILGTLGVQGTANLFLLNPRGIVFGPEARLDLRGSFVASTADGVVLSDGFDFSATQPQAPPLLSVAIPVGLRFRETPGAIVNQSVAQQSVGGLPSLGLGVDPGQAIALIGGDVRLNNGSITASQGTVLLGSVASPGVVGLATTPTGLTLDYGTIRNFGTIDLSNAASVNALGVGGGAIRIQGGRVTLRDRANLVADTIGDVDGRGIVIDATRFRVQGQAFIGMSTIGTGAAGDLTIRATEAIELIGGGPATLQRLFVDPIVMDTMPNLFDREGLISTGTASAGRAGNIFISTRQLRLTNGAVLLSPTLGTGSGGDVTIRATDLVDVNGSGILTTALNQGNAGRLTLNTRRLVVRGESLVSTSTFGVGNGGDLIINASESVRVSEIVELTEFGTSIATSTIGGAGDAGNLVINTRSLLVEGGATITSASGATATSRLIPSTGAGGNLTVNARDSITVTGSSVGREPSRSQIVTATLGDADSGDLSIQTRRLIVQDRGAIGASTVGDGQGGAIDIVAFESIDLIGEGVNQRAPTGIASTSGDRNPRPGFPANPTGAAGNITVRTGRLTLQNQAIINVESLAAGNAGAINLFVDSLTLDQRSQITGDTGSGTGGNINLRSQVLQLRRGSRISTDAGSSDGGNIAIDSQFLIGFPNQNSDITANARTAQGGRVTVNAPNIFGIAPLTRDQLRSRLGLTEAEFASLPGNPAHRLPSNDITAISQTAPDLSGTVVFNTSGINPAQSLVELPQTVVDPSTLIAANPCIQAQGQSEFVVTGRGGLPLNPNDTLSSQGVAYPWVQAAGVEEGGSGRVEEWESGGVGEWEVERVGGRESGRGRVGEGEWEGGRVDEEVQPAQGWVITEGGQVTLVAENPVERVGERSPQGIAACPPR